MSQGKEGSLGEKMGDGLVWLLDHITINALLIVLAFIVVFYLLWRLSLFFGPEKKCWRCGGEGWVRGLLGYRRECDWCTGKGRRPRIGSGR